MSGSVVACRRDSRLSRYTKPRLALALYTLLILLFLTLPIPSASVKDVGLSYYGGIGLVCALLASSQPQTLPRSRCTTHSIGITGKCHARRDRK